MDWTRLDIDAFNVVLPLQPIISFVCYTTPVFRSLFVVIFKIVGVSFLLCVVYFRYVLYHHHEQLWQTSEVINK
jgi:hypothetical protein